MQEGELVFLVKPDKALEGLDNLENGNHVSICIQTLLLKSNVNII
jgi:hypothetical protein